MSLANVALRWDPLKSCQHPQEEGERDCDPPSLKWSDLKYVFWHRGGLRMARKRYKPEEKRLKVSSITLDGEAVVCGEDGVSDFNARTIARIMKSNVASGGPLLRGQRT